MNITENTLYAGFSRLDITPPLGLNLSGYFSRRPADGILDPLEINCMALGCGTESAVICTCDLLGFRQSAMDGYRRKIAQDNGLDEEAVYIACTHTHTGPSVGIWAEGFLHDPDYNVFLGQKLSDAAKAAFDDLRPAEIGIGRSTLDNIAFIRRFKMKDGSTVFNPGIKNPNIDHPIGEPDTNVQVIRFLREGAPEIAAVNFQVHPDTVGGNRYSADYPRFVRETVEKVLDGVKCIYFNGAQGDTNHIDVRDGDRPWFGPHHPRSQAEYMGRSIAGAALQAYGRARAVPAEKILFRHKVIRVPANKADAAAVPDAEKLWSLYEAGRYDEIKVTDNLTTAAAEALRIKTLKDSPDFLELRVSAAAAAGENGGIAFVGFPGEPFTEIGRKVKENSPFDMTFISCCTNGYEGYFPVKSAYDEGGYEARSSLYSPGVAEALTDAGISVLNELHDLC